MKIIILYLQHIHYVVKCFLKIQFVTFKLEGLAIDLILVYLSVFTQTLIIEKFF